MIEAIIFDFGGVIIPEPEGDVNRYFSEKFSVPYDLTEATIEKLLLKFQTGDITDKEFWSTFATEVGIEMPEDYEKLWLNEASIVPRKPDVVEIVRKLGEAGYKLAILSNTIPPYARYNRENDNYNGFEYTILSSEAGMKKPNPEFYRLALERIGAQAQDCVYIDDKEKYLKPAEEIGMKTILFTTASQLEDELRSMDVKL